MAKKKVVKKKVSKKKATKKKVVKKAVKKKAVKKAVKKKTTKKKVVKKKVTLEDINKHLQCIYFLLEKIVENTNNNVDLIECQLVETKLAVPNETELEHGWVTTDSTDAANTKIEFEDDESLGF